MEPFSVEMAVGGLVTAIVLSLLSLWVARRINFFKFPTLEYFVPVTLLQTFGVFLIYLFIAAVAIPLLFAGAAHLFLNVPLKLLPRSTRMWGSLISIWISFFIILFYLKLMKKETVAALLWGPPIRSRVELKRSLKQGIIAWFISYPFILLVGSLTSLITYYFWGEGEVEQLAVEQLKKTLGNPPLFIAMALSAISIIPFVEELLFRGFLQSFLKNRLGRDWAIGLTAFLFAFFHFSPSQGIGNIQLISALFTLSLFLGFLYEKERTLLAPLGLHITFNSVTVLFIFLSH